jgi:hypothetical protein
MRYKEGINLPSFDRKLNPADAGHLPTKMEIPDNHLLLLVSPWTYKGETGKVLEIR